MFSHEEGFLLYEKINGREVNENKIRRHKKEGSNSEGSLKVRDCHLLSSVTQAYLSFTTLAKFLSVMSFLPS